MQPFIAVVDDDKSVRKALDRLLRSAGFDVETFVSGSEFLSSLKNYSPDCVVLDLHMPSIKMGSRQGGTSRTGIRESISELIRDRGATQPPAHFQSQPSGPRVFWPAALSLIGPRPLWVFSLFASRKRPSINCEIRSTSSGDSFCLPE